MPIILNLSSLRLNNREKLKLMEQMKLKQKQNKTKQKKTIKNYQKFLG